MTWLYRVSILGLWLSGTFFGFSGTLARFKNGEPGEAAVCMFACAAVWVLAILFAIVESGQKEE